MSTQVRSAPREAVSARPTKHLAALTAVCGTGGALLGALGALFLGINAEPFAALLIFSAAVIAFLVVGMWLMVVDAEAQSRVTAGHVTLVKFERVDRRYV